MKATCDFTAVFNGTFFKLKKGAAFRGSKEAQAHFAALGLIGKEAKDD